FSSPSCDSVMRRPRRALAARSNAQAILVAAGRVEENLQGAGQASTRRSVSRAFAMCLWLVGLASWSRGQAGVPTELSRDVMSPHLERDVMLPPRMRREVSPLRGLTV